MKKNLKRMVLLLNFYRLGFAILILKLLHLDSVCITDVKVSTENDNSSFGDILNMLVFNKCYRNIVCYRIKKKYLFGCINEDFVLE